MVTVEVKLDGAREVMVDAPSLSDAWREAMHYAAQYMSEPWKKSFEIKIKKEVTD